MIHHNDTIVAPASRAGGALGIIRLSGDKATEICGRVFKSPHGKLIARQKGFTILYGEIIDGAKQVIDDVLVSVFRAPHSYTGEDMVEISCHGSQYVMSRIVSLLVQAGARMAEAGEFTARAFLVGRFDLSQAEAVADIIASRNRATHAMAANQMRGGYSDDLKCLRGELLRLAAMMELELDFSEEDVQFANRGELDALVRQIIEHTDKLAASFDLGNAIKEGIGVAIVGEPNVGKSTLLNTLLREDRAMVSDIAGTTRDSIEESVNIGGVSYRFIDTAGIRKSFDRLEQMGIERTFKAVAKARIVLLVFDSSQLGDINEVEAVIDTLPLNEEHRVCIIMNKIDKAEEAIMKQLNGYKKHPLVCISAKYGNNIESVVDFLVSCVDTNPVYDGSTVISNARHYEALLRSQDALRAVCNGLTDGLSAELLVEDIRVSLHHLGTITGEITTGEILSEIFSKFCIGK